MNEHIINRADMNVAHLQEKSESDITTLIVNLDLDLKSNDIVDIIIWTLKSDGKYEWIEHPCTYNKSLIQEHAIGDPSPPVDGGKRLSENVFSFVTNRYIEINATTVMTWSYSPYSITSLINTIKKVKSISDTNLVELLEIEYSLRVRDLDSPATGTIAFLYVLFDKRIDVSQIVADNISTTDLDNICKSKWKELLIGRLRDITILIEDEIKQSENEPSLVTELKIILDQYKEIEIKIDTDINSIKTYTELISYWHPLLLPAPEFINF